MSDPMGLQLQMVVNCHVGAGTRLVFCNLFFFFGDRDRKQFIQRNGFSLELQLSSFYTDPSFFTVVKTCLCSGARPRITCRGQRWHIDGPILFLV